MLRASLGDLDRIPLGSFPEFLSDFRNLGCARHVLERAIQGLVGVGNWTIRKLALGTPATTHEVFDLLESAGRLPRGTVSRAAPLLALRTGTDDARRVFDVLTQHRQDLAEILDLLLAIDSG